MLGLYIEKLNKARLANGLIRLLAGGVVLTIGILMVIYHDKPFVPGIYLIAGLLLAAGVSDLISWCIKKPRRPLKLLLPFITITLGALIFVYINLPFYIVTIAFGVYLFASAVIELINAALVLRNHSGEFWLSLVPGLFYLIFSLLLLCMPNQYKSAAFIVIGIYCILFGGTYIADFIYSIVPVKTRDNVKRRIHISLPVLLAMFVPHSVLQDLNTFLAQEGHELEDRGDISGQKDDAPPDLEIFFHIANEGFNAIGHCDICFEGEIIAYGNYDEAAQLPIGMGPGVLIISNKEQYIPFCLEFNKTTIFSFGLRLNEQQKERIREKVAGIKQLLYPWDPPYAAACKQNPNASPEDYRDFSSWLAQATDSRFYKFTGGKYKTYFVMTTNCVGMVEGIVGQAGTDILGMSGIISPGTYYDYLQSEYLRRGSMVISRDVYKNEDGPMP